MIYPEEGSVLNSNPAAIVDAEWVAPDQVESANEWIDFLRSDDQQRSFLDAGFRPASGTDVQVDPAQMSTWGLQADRPTAIDPGELDEQVLDQIIGSWGAVKKPSIVTLVVDLSGSMEGEKLDNVQHGLRRLLKAMTGPDSASPDSQLGLVTFTEQVRPVVPPRPLDEAKFKVSGAIDEMAAKGKTALYDAIVRAVELTDAAPGPPDATRAVVVLSDGAATAGEACLDDIVAMTSDAEADIKSYCAKVDAAGTATDAPTDDLGDAVPVAEVNGASLRVPTDQDVQVFFVGFGDADIQIGRILAEATDAQYRGQTDDDLAAVIEALSGYF
jgi:Mg-chelatase subunit ChlD